jgi:hypothetical protein
MLSETSLTADQDLAVHRIYAEDHTVLVAATGVGKTVICLTAIKELIEEKFLRRVIVACPAKVLENMVWLNEAAKWKHLRGLRVLQLMGDSHNRVKQLLSCEAEVILVSLNNLDWLLQMDHECDGVIIDELSKAAGKQTKKLKSKKFAGMFKWRVGLSATPVSQDFLKLHPMCRIIDGGKALGTNKSKYLLEHFSSDYQGYNWTLRPGEDEKIMKKIASLVHLVTDNKAMTLPPLRERVMKFTMPTDTRVIYDEMKKHMVVGDIEAANQAVKSGKLRQIASGFMYEGDEGEAVPLDWARRDALAEWCTSLNGKPGLVFYEFVHQAEWCRPTNIRFAQINSMSHGVDGLQHEFADVLFIQPIWSRDATEQAVGRVWRQGQTKPVNVTTLVCENTLDDLVMARVEDRAQWMKLFKQHLQE